MRSFYKWRLRQLNYEKVFLSERDSNVFDNDRANIAVINLKIKYLEEKLAKYGALK